MVIAVACLGLLIAGLGTWSLLIEPRLLRVRELRFAHAHGPCRPVRLAIASDLHIGAPHSSLARLAKIVDRINSGKPDLVLLLGDYVSHRVAGGTRIPPEPIAAVLSELRAPLGVISVLGNHDWRSDGNRVGTALESGGITVLENDAIRLDLACGPLWIAGLADDSTRRPLPAKALEPVPEGDSVIVIAHGPASFRDTPSRSLIYPASHTHGGQVYLPVLGAPVLPSLAPRRHAYGLIEENGKAMYVTSGIGTSILPVRFNMPPEIVYLTIERFRS